MATNETDLPLKTQCILHDARREVEDARATLVKEARNLARDLLREAERVEKDPTYRPNSLGIVQFQGASVDRACLAIAERTEALARLERLIATAQED